MKRKQKHGSDSSKIPTFDRLMNPLLKALKELGGSGTIQEIDEKVIEDLKLPNEILDVPHGDKGSGQTEVAYRLAWARTYLKKYGILENSARGIWAIAPAAKGLNEIDPAQVAKEVREQFKGEKKSSIEATDAGSEEIEARDSEQPEEFQDWKKHLRRVLISLQPAAFERLIQRLLRESGFTQVEVTGKSGDGGIDGKGIVRVSGLLSFHVMFQCKKYEGTVSSNQIRDFRGAMQGRADKGLFVTTGAFTRDAIKEATRDGAPPIDLIDGEQLADKLKELTLGVRTKVFESIEIDEQWFRAI
jgi:restriction system protein